jgi:hypothetical protein
MGEAKRSVSCIPRGFMAAWGRGDAGPVPWRRMYGLLPLPRRRRGREARWKHLARLLTERSADGELVLQRRSDGACVHLGKQCCIIYEQRPAVCRAFDCRVFAAMGLVEHCGPSQQTPHWEFAGN